MQAHRKLWNEGIYGTGAWMHDNVTTLPEYTIISGDRRLALNANVAYITTNDEYRMQCLFFALFFGGDLEV